MPDFERAEALLREFKGDAYIHGLSVLSGVGPRAAKLGKRVALVRSTFHGSDPWVDRLTESLADAGVELATTIKGPRPNAPIQDLIRITSALIECNPQFVISFGGGSVIDCAKAAIILLTLGADIEDYFGTGLVSQAMEREKRSLVPHVAIQTASSSAAHLTKYSNITNLATGQKKLIVDEAITPVLPVFDYEATLGAPAGLTADGALDGMAHSLEVLYGAVGAPSYLKIQAVAAENIRLAIKYLPQALDDPQDAEARQGLGLATDLGGYAIMLGGTNGAHLTSFSLVDILSHGRACAIMNPYYTVFFAPAIQEPLKVVGQLFKDADYTRADIDRLCGRDLALAVAEAMLAFERRVGLPTTLDRVPGFSGSHIQRALAAAKNPQLKMKLENMPVPLSAETVDEYMGPVLEAAKTGDLSLIRNVR
ncbi:MAG: iron-containing alcohol dehydrogenase [Anaerolineales bacterium]|nr:iron-containing alcohol dehydrogenase [Anaerolineales bacterium]